MDVFGDCNGQATTFVHEVVLNTCTRFGDCKLSAANAENGSVTGPTLMGLADEVRRGRKTLTGSIAERRSGRKQHSARDVAARRPKHGYELRWAFRGLSYSLGGYGASTGPR